MGTSALASMLIMLTLSAALPVKYDQRQEGELNVHAHLENFVIVLIPSSGGLSFLNYIPFRKNTKDTADKYAPPSTGTKSSSPDFPAGKSPYKIDLDKSSDVEKDDSTDKPAEAAAEEVVIMPSPSTLSKTPDTQEHGSTASAETSVDVTTEVIENTNKVDEIKTDEKKEVNVDKKIEKEDKKEEKDTGKNKVEKEVEHNKDEKIIQKGEEKDDLEKIENIPVMDKTAKSIDFIMEIPASSLRSATQDELSKPNKSFFAGSQNIDTSEEQAHRLKILRSSLSECSPDERRDSQGLCQKLKPRQRSGQYFTAESLLSALQFGLSPASD